jgi:dihydrofolate synthase/folylpolyglutamate synthase
LDLDDAQAYLDAHIDLEKTTGISAGHVAGLSLDRMRALVGVLGDPQRDYPVIHITGTNGKGSTARMITALLAAHQISVGTYTSPHLEHVTERISRNGEPIDPEQLAAVVSEIATLEDQGLLPDRPSYFELLTAAAFAWFSQEAVDVAVVEVGLLGRYDATNVADGQVAVITNVGKDHTDGEGDWRRRVAAEKAGIVKPGSHLVLGETDLDLRPLFTGQTAGPVAAGPSSGPVHGNGRSGTGPGNGDSDSDSDSDSVDDSVGDGGGDATAGTDAAEAPEAAVWVRDVDFGVMTDRVALGGHVVELRTPYGEHDEVFLPAHGAHQSDNAALAVAAVEAFFGRALHEDVVTEAFAGLRLPGRFEVVHRAPLLVLDGAHNPDGAAAAAATLAEEFSIAGTRRWVLGMLAGRDLDEMLDAFGVRPGDRVVATTPPTPRGVPAAELAAAVERRGVQASAVDDIDAAVATAWRAAQAAGEGDLVMVTGSLYAVGAARTACRRLGLLT